MQSLRKGIATAGVFVTEGKVVGMRVDDAGVGVLVGKVDCCETVVDGEVAAAVVIGAGVV